MQAAPRSVEPESDRSLVVERVIDAPARLLYEAYTKPEHLMRWFGPPGYPLTHCEMDFRVGGAFRFAMTGPDGAGGPPFGGTYLEIVKDKRIVYDNAFLDERGFVKGRMIVTVTFDEVVPEQRTRLVIHTLCESAEMKNEIAGFGHVQGTLSTFPALEAVANDLARTFTITRVIAAPARLLFDTYAKREHLLKWFGPAGYPLTLCELDFRVGGTYRFAMTGPDGKQMTPFGGKYREIVPNKKIVYDDTFEQPGAEEMVVTVMFDERDDGKTVLKVCTVFGSDAMMKEHMKMGYEQGVGICATQMEALALELLAELVAKERV
jgi:uncharacterized protein YndB with AHSA1/START domain